jgi:hypothetical protein
MGERKGWREATRGFGRRRAILSAEGAEDGQCVSAVAAVMALLSTSPPVRSDSSPAINVVWSYCTHPLLLVHRSDQPRTMRGAVCIAVIYTETTTDLLRSS